MRLIGIIGVVLASFSVASISQAAVIDSKPSPVYAVGANGIGHGEPAQMTVSSSDPGGEFGAVGFRIRDEAKWTRCQMPDPTTGDTPVFIDEAFASTARQGTHYIEVADDYDQLQTGSTSCQDKSTPPPGEITSVPFIVDRTRPYLSGLSWEQVGPRSAEVCEIARDDYSGLHSMTFVMDPAEPERLTVPLDGEPGKRVCRTFEWYAHGRFVFDIIVEDWAGNRSIQQGSLWIERRTSATPKKPFRFKVKRKKVSRQGRSVRIWFGSNLSGVRYGCAVAGKRPVKCSSPARFTRLPRGRSKIVLRATDRRGRVRTIRVPIAFKRLRS